MDYTYRNTSRVQDLISCYNQLSLEQNTTANIPVAEAEASANWGSLGILPEEIREMIVGYMKCLDTRTVKSLRDTSEIFHQYFAEEVATRECAVYIFNKICAQGNYTWLQVKSEMPCLDITGLNQYIKDASYLDAHEINIITIACILNDLNKIASCNAADQYGDKIEKLLSDLKTCLEFYAEDEMKMITDKAHSSVGLLLIAEFIKTRISEASALGNQILEMVLQGPLLEIDLAWHGILNEFTNGSTVFEYIEDGIQQLNPEEMENSPQSMHEGALMCLVNFKEAQNEKLSNTLIAPLNDM